MKDLSGEILQALVKAPPGRKQQALKLLRGEALPDTHRDEPLLYSVSQAARVLGVSRTTLWRMCQSGYLSKVPVMTGTYRIRRTDIEAIARDGVLAEKGGAS